MKFIRTLNQVQYSENTLYGNRACDLAHLAAERTPVPETFVLTCEAWETFVKGLKYKIDFILQQVNTEKNDTLVSAYNSIRRLLVNEQIPDSILFELKEAYESLGTGIELDEMTKEETSPFVSMIVSPDYVAEAESFEGIIQNIHTIEEITIALKEIYAMQFTPEAIKYRKKTGIKGFRCAIIIQSMPESKASATAYSTDPEQQEMVFVHAYKGFTDIRDLVAKDFFHVKKEYLTLAASQIVEQTKIVVRDEEGKLFPDEFASRGQSMNDKEVMEVARLAKKSEKILGNPTKLFIAQEKDEFFVLWANRYDVPNRKTPESLGSSIGSMTVSEASAQGAKEMHDEALSQAQFDTSVDEGDEDTDIETVQEEPDDFEREFDDSEDEPEKEDPEDSEAVDEPEFIDEDEKDPEDDESDEDSDEYIEYEERSADEEPDEEADDEYIEYDDESEEKPEEDSDEDSDDEYEASSDEELDDEPEDDEDSEEKYDESSDEEADDEDSDEYIEYEADEDSDEEPEEDADDEYIEYETDDEQEDDEDSEEKYDEDSENLNESESHEDYDDEFIGAQDEEPEGETNEEPGASESDDTKTAAEDEGTTDVGSSQEDKDIINKSVRVIYAELAKRYEETGEQAPDTITELIQKGVQKNAFNIEGLSEVLDIKRKIRTDEAITEEEKNHILEIVNKLV